ncbi:arylsulfotransferase family protein [Streptomyces sp. 6N223]|uniref:arylsulfotransferase family protein n=1 Tax=Streptomyces sp. 6N223 TaxID=3457412 RepID=UPI003FD4CC69
MTQLTRRSLLGGLVAAGAGTLLPGTAQANAPTTASSGPVGHRTATATAPPPAAFRPLQQQPPQLDILTRQPGTAPGLLFLTPQGFAAPDSPRGPQIVDDEGRMIWFRQVPNGTFTTDFRVQSYQGQPVVTWWEGTVGAGGIGSGMGYIADSTYQVIATVQTPDAGATLDMHEFLITPSDTALVISFRDVPHDLTPVGGPQNGTAIDCVVQEIDIATGQAVLDWHGIDQVPVEEADVDYPGSSAPFDYLHVNAVSLDGDGNLLISGRHTSTIYKVDRVTGEILWRLGGSNSDFELGAGARFTGHHDGQSEGGNVYRLFDNGTQIARQSSSRVVWIETDPELGTATLLDEVAHPEMLSALAEGNAQRLPNGNTIVSWGAASRVSEFGPDGTLLLDGAFPQGISSYRAYRMEWQGQPAGDPEVAVDAAAGEVHAIWNGATGVAAWRVLAGESEARLRPVARAPWNGLDTAVPLPASARRGTGCLQVQALDHRGRLLGASPVRALADARAGAV